MLYWFVLLSWNFGKKRRLERVLIDPLSKRREFAQRPAVTLAVTRRKTMKNAIAAIALCLAACTVEPKAPDMTEFMSGPAVITHDSCGKQGVPEWVYGDPHQYAGTYTGSLPNVDFRLGDFFCMVAMELGCHDAGYTAEKVCATKSGLHRWKACAPFGPEDSWRLLPTKR